VHVHVHEMSDPILHPEDVEGVGRPSRGYKRLIGYVIGLGLLAASIVFAVQKADFSKIREADPQNILMLCGLVVVGLGTNAMLFWFVTKPFETPGKPVKLREWIALVASTSLLNYAGAKVGLIGRIAYLKKFHAVSYRANVFTLVALAVGTIYIYFCIGGLTLWRDGFDTVWVVMLLGLLVVGSFIASLLLPAAIRRYGGGLPIRRDLPIGIFAWSLVRVADTFVIAGRLLIASHVLGKPIDIELAVIAAVVCNLIVMVAPIPGGLGIREWFGALIVQWGFKGAATLKLAEGAGILVVDRVAEIIVFIATGLIALAYLHYRAGKQESIKTEKQEIPDDAT